MLYRVIILAGLLGLVGGAGCAGCDGGGFPIDALPDAASMGTVSLAWSLRDFNGQPIQCDDVGANTVFLQLRNRTKATGAAVSLSCNNSPSTSQLIEPGVYDVTFELHGFNVTLAVAADQNAVVIGPGQDTPLAPIMFVVDAKGTLILSLTAPPTTANCKPVGLMGAGITGMTITLVHPGNACASITFIRARGATSLGSYTINCSSPMVTTCIENDETLTATSMPSGPYTIHIRGKVGANDCWRNDDGLQVPPQGKTLNPTLNLAFVDNAGC